MKEILAITRALGDESRLRALAMLRGGELCVCQIIETLKLAPSTVSKHMTVLHQAGLVERRKEGKWAYYRLAGRGGAEAARGAVRWALGCLEEDAKARADQKSVCCVKGKDLEEICACYRK